MLHIQDEAIDTNEYSNEENVALRVAKTRDAVQNSFEHLLETAEYGSIAVSTVAREALVSFKTF